MLSATASQPTSPETQPECDAYYVHVRVNIRLILISTVYCISATS